MTETVMLPPHQRSATLRAESFDPADNTIEVTFTTGAAVLRYDWDGGYEETLDVTPKAVRLQRLNAGAPFLNTHSSYDLEDIIGCVAPGTARIEDKKGICRIKLSSNPDRAGVVGDIVGGVIRNVSVGYIIHQVIRTDATEGEIATVRVTDWEPIEISAVPIPADASAQIRSGTEGAPETYAATVIREIDPVIEARAAETARTHGILKIARQMNLPDAVADKALNDNTTLDAFRALAIDAASEPAKPVVEPIGRSAASDPSTTTETSAVIAASPGASAMERQQEKTDMNDVPPAAVAPAPAAPAIDAVEVRKAETARVQEILRTSRKLGLGEDFSNTAIEGNITLDAFRAMAIDERHRKQEETAPGHFAPNAGASDPSHRTYAAAAQPVEKGVNAARIMVALAATNGSRRDAIDFVTQKYGTAGDAAARALTTSIGSGGGFLVPPEMSNEIIELLRPASVVMASKPVILPMPSGNLMIPRVTAASTANYIGENQPIAASQPAFGMVQLQARKLAAEVPISNDMIRYASASTDAVVRDDMVRSIAVRSDLAFIRGSGQYSPRGLKSWATEASLNGNNTLTANYLVGSAYGAVSQAQAIAALTSVTADLGKLELALMNANIPMTRPGWLFAPRTMEYLMNIRDGLGNQVYYAEMSQGRLRGKPYKTTTQIPTNLAGLNSDGATANTLASEVYLADFAEVFIGEAYGLQLDVFPGGAYVDASGTMQSGISNDQTVMRAIVQHDMGMRQEAAVAVLTGVCWF